LVKKLQENRKPSAFPTQNNNLCVACGWEGNSSELSKRGSSMISRCPECGGIYFREVIKPEFVKLPPADRKAPFEGERKHTKHGPWRIY